MSVTADQGRTGIVACGCVTALGDARATVEGLLAGRVALQPRPVLGRDGGDAVPLALIGGTMDEALPPRWIETLRALVKTIPGERWGTAGRPVIVTSSNFGVGSLYAFMRDREVRHLKHGPPFATVEMLQREFGWGENVTVFSHACVTAHLGLAHAGRLLAAGLAEEALVVSFDFVSAFVAGGFHSLKILNGAMPAPFIAREIGAIGLGDGAAFAVLRRDEGAAEFTVEAHALHNEMHHFTSNRADGSGFAACLEEVATAVHGERVWVKGHGTGTLEAGRLEAETVARVFPGAPLVSWKGSLGHTLGSCGLVELALAVEALRGPAKKIPGSVGSAGAGQPFTAGVATEPLAGEAFDAAVLTSNAFGGAHAAMVLRSRGPVAVRPAITKRESETIVRFIHQARVEMPGGNETAAEARERLREKFPRAALRRMTHLGLLLGAALDGIALVPDDALVYATSYAETRALEEFLSSFPSASPLLFQTSIHPGGVQQVLIGRQQPIARLWPLAGKARLVEQALITAAMETAPRVLLVGGEERGTWLLEQGMASERALAFALELRREAAGAIGRVELRPQSDSGQAAVDAAPALIEFVDCLAQRRARAWRGMEGSWSLTWA